MEPIPNQTLFSDMNTNKFEHNSFLFSCKAKSSKSKNNKEDDEDEEDDDEEEEEKKEKKGEDKENERVIYYCFHAFMLRETFVHKRFHII
ncbi:unnamed protein product [Echinostoma caproni]|uniref:Uncharacterized protein n=1 Tax=Echinostoma caproni TaxID=27848 RepID=A0A183A5T2_9TREM|nr:unnamed protein product [Echinostoma caproni]